MCGILGTLSSAADFSKATAQLELGLARLRHRGPDDDGRWTDAAAGVWLGHRRLAVVELSPAGKQPMVSPSGRYVIVFNGEVYNFEQLRHELEAGGWGSGWRGHSDTEVVLAAFQRWGPKLALEKMVGMFALALWDRASMELVLARDRVGEKPLYYGFVGGDFVFSSELKGLTHYPGWKGEVDRASLTLFLKCNYIPAPHTIYAGIHKLSAGHYLTLKKGDASPAILKYWDARTVVQNGVTGANDQLDDVTAIELLEEKLKLAISGQMIADVPLGAFLSGGIDSSTVVALMQSLSSRPVRTFSIGFEEEEHNEAEYAKSVARHLGTDHTEVYVTARQALDVIPSLPAVYDEPFADSSQIPTVLLSQITRSHVTVALSGDGGDELFAGYNHYLFCAGLWKELDKVPKSFRKAAAAFLSNLSPSVSSSLLKYSSRLLPRRFRYDNPGGKISKLVRALNASRGEDLYDTLVSHWPSPETLVIGGACLPTISKLPALWPNVPSLVERMMYFDLMTYLPDDIFVKVDRAAMSTSLETRAPFADHRLVEFAWQVPLHRKLRDGDSKWLLRQVLYRYVPRDLVDRPKKGFTVPIDAWLRGPLKEWAEALLSEDRLRRDGYFHAEPIRKAWRELLVGRSESKHMLWGILMFQAWLSNITN